MTLGDHEVHLWWTRPDRIAEDLLPRYRELLDETEVERMDRFLFERDRRLFLVAHALLRWVLVRYVGGDPARLRFLAGGQGRPELDPACAGRRVRFNLSHTRGLAACAVTASRDVGVDVEPTTRTVEPGLARRFFAPREVKALGDHPEARRPAHLLDIWTLKESCIKARGLGLPGPLGRVAFELRSGVIRLEVDPELGDRGADWWLLLVEPHPGHRLAVAVRSGGRTMRWTAREAVPLVGRSVAAPRVLGETLPARR